MNLLLAASLSCACLFAGCASAKIATQAGYTQLHIDGSVALESTQAGPGADVEQDIGSGLGLGDDRGSPFVRVDVDFGWPVLTASGFTFHELGQGVLRADFGGLAQATPVSSELDFGCLKLAAVCDVEIGPVTLSPGLAFDVFDFDFRVSDQFGNSEVIDELVGVPLLFARAAAYLGAVQLMVEGGYVEGLSGETEGDAFFDLEGQLRVCVSPSLHLLAGYRFLGVDATGDTGTEVFGLDLQVHGWFVGGGFTF